MQTDLSGAFADLSCNFDDLELVFLQTPPSLRATSPNLGEESGYLFGVNAIILTNNMLTHYWLSNEQGN